MFFALRDVLPGYNRMSTIIIIIPASANHGMYKNQKYDFLDGCIGIDVMSMPWVSGSSMVTIRPLLSIAAVMPELEARITHVPVSAARICDMARCCRFSAMLCDHESSVSTM